jgi:uncharacterized LabA/DUF88 family protein
LNNEKRVIAYIDGLNLYNGIKESGWDCYLWLNLKNLCLKFIEPDQTLLSINYYTTRIEKPKSEKRRQSIYLEALQEITNIEPKCGKFENSYFHCRDCGFKNAIPVEKMTDVQLATNLVADAFLDKYDTAFIVTGDKDFVPAIKRVRSEFADKKIVVLSPPLRDNSDLKDVANGHRHITPNELSDSLLPEIVVKKDGYALERPIEWT